MNSARRPFLRLLAWWAAALILAGGYFALLYRIAPEILAREGRWNHSDLFALADKNYKRARELRWVLPAEEKVRLLDEAAAALEEAVRQRPDSSDYQWYLGQVLYLRAHQEEPPDPGMVERAVGIVEKVWESTGQEWRNPGEFLADYYARHGAPARAEVILERLLSLYPESPYYYTALLDLFLSQDRDEKAFALLARKEENLPLWAEDLDRLARLNLAKEDYPAAIEALNRLVIGGSGDASRRLLLAEALRGAGEFEAAFRILREFVEALGPGARLRPAKWFGLNRYPEGILPALAYLWLEERMESSSP